jgi:hypothetical protein
MSRAIDPGILRGLYSLLRSGIFRRLIFIACLGLIFPGGVILHAEDVGAPRQSKTGPVPPDAVVARDAANQNQSFESHTAEVTLSAPGYLWRHGCGPTAVGMVVGYYDGQGYEDLIPGEAATQTSDVNQAIASGGNSSSPNPPGSEEHYEDYARPQDSWPTMLTDDYITQGRPDRWRRDPDFPVPVRRCPPLTQHRKIPWKDPNWSIPLRFRNRSN